VPGFVSCIHVGLGHSDPFVRDEMLEICRVLFQVGVSRPLPPHVHVAVLKPALGQCPNHCCHHLQHSHRAISTTHAAAVMCSMTLCWQVDFETMYYTFEPLMHTLIRMQLANKHTDLATRIERLISQLTSVQQFGLMTFCLSSPDIELIEHGMNWLNTYLTGGGPLPECQPLNDNLELFAHTAAIVVQSLTDESLDRAFQMVISFGKRLQEQQMCPQSAVKLFLTTCIVPHGKTAGIGSLSLCTKQHGEALLKALLDCCACDDVFHALKVHEIVVGSDVLDRDVRTVAFTNLLQHLAGKQMAVTQGEAVREMISSIDQQLPHALDAPMIAAFRSHDVDQIEGAILHLLVIVEYKGIEFITPGRFVTICRTASTVGCMAFLWECTRILSTASKWQQESNTWDRVSSCAREWDLAIDASIMDGTLLKFGTPSLTIVFELLKQLWRLNPKEERPLFVEFVVAQGEGEMHSAGDEELLASVWTAFRQLYVNLHNKCNFEQSVDDSECGQLEKLCVWTPEALQGVPASGRIGALIEQVTSNMLARDALHFDKSLLSIIDSVSHFLTIDEYTKLIATSWRCLSSEDMGMLATAGGLFIEQAHCNPTRIRGLICTALYSQCPVTRKLGLKRFWNLWSQRKKLGGIYEVVSVAQSPTVRKKAVAMVHLLHMKMQQVQDTSDLLPPIFGIAASPMIDLTQDACFEVASMARQLLNTCLSQDTLLFLSSSIHQMGNCVHAVGSVNYTTLLWQTQLIQSVADSQIMARIWAISTNVPSLPESYAAAIFTLLVLLIVKV
jgi:hypothetical protein